MLGLQSIGLKRESDMQGYLILSFRSGGLQKAFRSPNEPYEFNGKEGGLPMCKMKSAKRVAIKRLAVRGAWLLWRIAGWSVGRESALALGANRPVRVNQQETDSEVCSPYRIISGWVVALTTPHSLHHVE